MAPESRGRFITFEGGEGVGKSTQLRHLAATLTAAGVPAIVTREPGGTPGAEAVRSLLLTGEAERWSPLSEALLLAAARVDHVLKVIRPGLDAGRWVLCDRFSDSTRVYQGCGRGPNRGGGVSAEVLTNLESWVGLRPDLTLVLDLPAEEGMARANARAGDGVGEGPDRFESMELGFHRRLREGFLRLAMADPERCVMIDARPDEATVAATIRAAVRARLGGGLS